MSSSPGKNGRPFFVKSWVSLRPLSTLFGILFGRTPSISLKKSWIGQIIYSIYKLFSQNLMLTKWLRRQFWFSYFATACGHLFVPRSSKMTVRKTPRSRLLRRLLPKRPKPSSTFRLGFEKWMFAVFRVINPPLRRTNASKRKFPNKLFQVSRAWIPASSTLREHHDLEQALKGL